MDKPTIYIVSDGKPGHLAQSRGLAEAIGRRVSVDICESGGSPREIAETAKTSAHGLILSAGRKTTAGAYYLKLRLQIPSVALMNPGWFRRREFDLCVIPRHDGIPESDRVIVTEGALNSITPAIDASPNEALLLIGGPSKHHHWEDESIAAQLHTLLGRDQDLRWTATSSRRTPDSTDQLLRELADEHGDRFVYTPGSETPRGWVGDQLQRCGVCWVSEDSVSMVYEALTAGASVGLLEVPRHAGKPGRVVRGVQSLVDRGWVTAYHDWREGKSLACDRPPLAEADRVAQIFLERFPTLSQ